MQGGDVDLLRLRLQNRAGDIVLTQRYRLLQSLVGVEACQSRHTPPVLLVEAIEHVDLIRATHIQHIPRAEQRRIREAGRRVGEEGTTRHGQPLRQRAAVRLHVHGSGASGRVVAGRVLLLQHDDAPPLREPVRRRGAGHAGTDDQKVTAFHRVHSMRRTPRPKRRDSALAGTPWTLSASRAWAASLAPPKRAGADHGDFM